MTTGTRASASTPHASSSSGSTGLNTPTCTCTLNSRAPAARASRTSSPADGSGKKVPEWTASGTRAANSVHQSLSHRAIPVRWA